MASFFEKLAAISEKSVESLKDTMRFQIAMYNLMKNSSDEAMLFFREFPHVIKKWEKLAEYNRHPDIIPFIEEYIDWECLNTYPTFIQNAEEMSQCQNVIQMKNTYRVNGDICYGQLNVVKLAEINDINVFNLFKKIMEKINREYIQYNHKWEIAINLAKNPLYDATDYLFEFMTSINTIENRIIRFDLSMDNGAYIVKSSFSSKSTLYEHNFWLCLVHNKNDSDKITKLFFDNIDYFTNYFSRFSITSGNTENLDCLTIIQTKAMEYEERMKIPIFK